MSVYYILQCKKKNIVSIYYRLHILHFKKCSGRHIVGHTLFVCIATKLSKTSNLYHNNNKHTEKYQKFKTKREE